MDNNYSIARRIWRILYPPGVFLIIQFIVMGVIGFVAGIYIAADGTAGGMTITYIETIVGEAMRFSTEHSMLILLISNIICFAVFLPVWLKARQNLDPYKNDGPAVVCLLIIGLFAAFNVVQMVLFALTNVMDYFPEYGEVSELFITDAFIVQLVSIGIVAPVVEEIVFRGILISRMKWMPVWVSVLIQGMLFGLVHLNVFQGLYAFVAGILLGMVFIKFRSIIIVIAGHMAYNLTSVLLAEYASETTSGMILALSAIVLPVCAVLTIKRQKARKLLTELDIMPPPVYSPGDPWSGYHPRDPWQ